MYDNNYDMEAQNTYGLKGAEQFNPRLGFIRKVYGILGVQLSITALFVLAVYNVPSISNAIYQGTSLTLGLLFTSMAVSFVIMCMLMCCMKFAREVPTNYILLGIFTLCESYMVAWICAFYSAQQALLAAALTASITYVLTVYAWTTKTDFTVCGGLIWIAAWALFAFGFLFMFNGSFYKLETAWICWLVLGVVIYGIYLIYDTQLIIGGKRYQLSMDDYVIGALVLYLDIIMIFIKILQIIGARK